MKKDVMKELKEGQDIDMVKEKDPKQPTLNYGVPGRSKVSLPTQKLVISNTPNSI